MTRIFVIEWKKMKFKNFQSKINFRGLKMKNIARFISIIFVLIGCGEKSEIQSTPPKLEVNIQKKYHDSILVQANKMQEELIKGNLTAFMTYVHPDIINGVGGPDKMIEIMKPDLENMIKQIEKKTFGSVSEVISDNNQLVAFILVETIYNFPKGRFHQRSYMIACSVDEGKSWTFFDGSGNKEQENFFRKKFPILISKIPFPICENKKLEEK